MRALMVALVVSSMSACLLPLSSTSDALTSGDERTVELDPAYTAPERVTIARCFARWRAFSGGAVRLRLVTTDGDLALRRSPSPTGHDHAVSFATRTGYLNADALGSELEEVCLSMVGSASGIRRHGEDGVLGPWVTPDFTAADRSACVAAGVCS